MIDLSTMQGLSIPEGNVTQIESGGRVIWSGEGKIVLEVKMVNASNIQGKKGYFLGLNIHFQEEGKSVTVSYGGVIKKLSATTTVIFGNRPGESYDTAEYPERGILTIEGDCRSFGVAQYAFDSENNSLGYCPCITKVVSWGRNISLIASAAFAGCDELSSVTIPKQISSINSAAFRGCTGLKSVTLPEIPPTLKYVNAFERNHPDRKFYVSNEESLEAYLSATNWSAYANSFVVGTPPKEE